MARNRSRPPEAPADVARVPFRVDADLIEQARVISEKSRTHTLGYRTPADILSAAARAGMATVEHAVGASGKEERRSAAMARKV